MILFQENSECIKNDHKAKILLVNQNDQKMARKLPSVNKRISKNLGGNNGGNKIKPFHDLLFLQNKVLAP